MDVLLSAGDDAALLEELKRGWPHTQTAVEAPGLASIEGWSLDEAALSPLVFSRQMLPTAERVTAASVRAWADHIFARIVGFLPDDRPWRLHIHPFYDGRRVDSQIKSTAGRRRCALIRAALLEQLKARRRRLLRRLRDETTPFAPDDALVQLLLTSPESGWLSVAQAPLPHVQRRMIWPFPMGEVSIARDTQAPSRAFAKLVEAEQRLNRRIESDETCVDLGATPGSWSYVALKRGARVTAVDRSPLRDDLMGNARLRFVRGDAFAFAPEAPVDWLLCDVIAAPQRSIDLTLRWLERRWARNFVITIKFKGRSDYAQLDRLKTELPPRAEEWFLVRLCANKNEVCVFGRRW